jgi:ribosomal-protein-alanine N-acetyltransferase
MSRPADIRGMAPSDVDAVAAIHAACFDDAWNSSMLRRILAMPGASGLSAVSPAGGAVVGFTLARVVADECELLSIGVAPSWRGRGIGARLLDTVMAHAIARAARTFYLEVEEGNATALRLYARRGLVPVGRRSGYYELKGGGSADALTMRCDLAGSAAEARQAGE